MAYCWHPVLRSRHSDTLNRISIISAICSLHPRSASLCAKGKPLEKSPEKTNTKSVHPAVALQEEQYITNFYRNRNLILAQTVFELSSEVSSLRDVIAYQQEEIARLTPAEAPAVILEG